MAQPFDVNAAMDAGIDAFEADMMSTASPAAVPSPEPEAPPSQPAEAPAQTQTQTTDEAAQVGGPPSASSTRTETPDPWASVLEKLPKDQREWVLKHGGDPVKALDNAWRNNNELAEIRRKEKEQSTTPPAAPEVPNTPQAEAVSDPEINGLKEELRVLNDRYNSLEQRKLDYSTKYEELTGEVDKLTRALATNRIPLDQVEEQRERLATLIDQRDQYWRAIGDIKTSNERLVGDYRTKELLLRQVEGVYKITKAREAEVHDLREREEQRSAQVYGDQFLSKLDRIAGDGANKVPPDLLDDFKARARHSLAELPQLPEGEDMDRFLADVKARWDRMSDTIHRGRSAQYAVAKASDANVKAPDGKDAVAPETKRRNFKSQKEVQDLIDSGFEEIRI